MDRVQQLLDVVPLPVLLGLPAVGVLLFFLIPPRRRVTVSLVVLVPWMTLGRLPDFPVLAAVCKVTGFAAFLFVLLSALFDPGSKRRLNAITWVYPVMALAGFVYVITTSNVVYAFAIRAQWLFLVLAAIAVARTIVDEDSLKRVIRGLTWGVCIAVTIPFFELLLNPAEAFRAGLGRFEPWGAPSNIIGILFAITAPLALYASVEARNLLTRFIYLGFALLGAGMGVLTASRTTVIVMLGIALPVALYLIRRPIYAVLATTVLVAGVVAILDISGESRIDRLGSLETGRAEQTMIYLEVIADRPLLGLLETTGESVLFDEDIGSHPHNAYTHTLYFGGITYALPMFIMIAVTMLSTYVVWRARGRLANFPLLITFLSAMMAMVYAQGLVNGAIYYPTYTWAFIHIMLSTLMICIAAELRVGQPGLFPGSIDDGSFEYGDEPEPDLVYDEQYGDEHYGDEHYGDEQFGRLVTS